MEIGCWGWGYKTHQVRSLREFQCYEACYDRAQYNLVAKLFLTDGVVQLKHYALSFVFYFSVYT